MIKARLIDPETTALIVVDIQNDYISNEGKIAQELGLNMTPVQAVVPRIIDFVYSARHVGLPIIFTQMIEDPAYMNENAQLKKGKRALCTPGTIGFDYYQIVPQESDYQLEKRTYDAFSNLELDEILTRHDIESLIVVGAYTAVCVDTTIRSGFTRGYHIVVPEDLVGMPQERMYQHEAAVDVWKIIFAHVCKSVEISSHWQNIK